MAKQRFDEAKVTRGPDGRFIAQGDSGASGAYLQRVRQRGAEMLNSAPSGEYLQQVRQRGTDQLRSTPSRGQSVIRSGASKLQSVQGSPSKIQSWDKLRSKPQAQPGNPQRNYQRGLDMLKQKTSAKPKRGKGSIA